eukprot:COSAG05_NODE_129_length_17200_cov_47.810128_5_plen_44_part_00
MYRYYLLEVCMIAALGSDCSTSVLILVALARINAIPSGLRQLQ